MKQVKENVPKYTNYKTPKVPASTKRRMQVYDDADPKEFIPYGVLGDLTPSELLVVTEMASDLMTGAIRPDTQLAEDINVPVMAIYHYRRNPFFNRALGVLAATVVRGRVMKYVGMIEKHAEKDWRAAKFLMEWVGLFIPKMQNLNLNVTATSSQVVFETSEEAIFAFIKKVKSMGWSLERIAEIYNAD